ncbi:hypothetical protein ACFORH_39030 [Amycolatopsis roodepoortensis]|uniref:ParB family chromosome partitioning protein n=1 Tax=Amycolatopsis roodepoortensis TaxID=700274 RepID=A0ABR9LIM1_9PSEU|nr:hypothetical protein [Amycolatopsis roodepoortensis]MBE1580509.1 ParB family chromosome partitioning protein [Amycolatopsis roodepoortensis]
MATATDIAEPITIPDTISEDPSTVTATETAPADSTAVPAVETPAPEKPKRTRRKTTASGSTAFGDLFAPVADDATGEEESPAEDNTPAEEPTAEAPAEESATAGDSAPVEESAPEATPVEEETPAEDKTPKSTGEAGGITGALGAAVTAAPIDGEDGSFRIAPKLVAPHPFNSPERSKPQPGNPKWEQLQSSVKKNGVLVPAKVVTLAAFLAARPEQAEAIERQAAEDKAPTPEYVAIYGHRRRAAAIDTGRPLKITVDDSIMENDGDLVYLAEENYGRDDFTELEEARMFANFLNGISQRTLAKRLGRSQATISRRLALLNTVEEVQLAIEGRNLDYIGDNNKPMKLAAPEAAVIAGQLPYCDPSVKKEGSLSPERREDQLAALDLVIKRGWSATTACESVTKGRANREMAAKKKIDIVDPNEKFGPKMYERLIRDSAAVEEGTKAGTVVASVDSSGDIRYYSTVEKPKTKSPKTNPGSGADSAQSKASQEEKDKAEARDKRRAVLAAMVKTPLPQKEMPFLLARQYNNTLAQMASSREGGKLAAKLWITADVKPQFGDVEQWIEGMEANQDPKVDLHGAWARALAAFELRARYIHADWGPEILDYFDLLRERGKYMPTAWEQARLDRTRAKVDDAVMAAIVAEDKAIAEEKAAAEAETDAEPKADAEPSADDEPKADEPKADEVKIDAE